ncbi:MAG: sulfoxide reductase heme-binding subunit YedZ [Gammaproteobacteria bacterium]|nr:sulfoxide reductase heme-binding subunit YedZ [Gammaproteobacteria bacterium]
MSDRAVIIAKPFVFIAALVPLALLIVDVANDALGANPIETLNRYTGEWTLRFLLITLALTPLRQLTGWYFVIRFRRMLGLFAFFYVCLHFLSWIWVDKGFDVVEIVNDVYKRPFITVGFICLLLLLPLAFTSTAGMVRRLGGKRWRALHRLVYLIGIGGIIHFLWMTKSDFARPLIYATILALLLGYRVWVRWRLQFPRRVQA